MLAFNAMGITNPSIAHRWANFNPPVEIFFLSFFFSTYFRAGGYATHGFCAKFMVCTRVDSMFFMKGFLCVFLSVCFLSFFR